MDGLTAVTSIVIAAITAGPVYLGLRHNTRKTEESLKILRGNGKGAVDKMLAEVLNWQGQHAVEDEARFARLEGALKNTVRRAKAQGATAERAARG